MTQRDIRPWGFWTQAKLRILGDYLPEFLRASSGRADEFVYLDAFAGEGRGRDNITGQTFEGSARIALDTDVAGGFTRLRYFEREGKAEELERQLRADYPGRDIRVYGGDCNTNIPQALAELRHLNWAPTFAFVDPDGMEFRWSTLEALATHKLGYGAPSRRKREYKVELWILFPTQGLIRTLALDPTKVSEADKRRATRLFGCEDWRPIYERRRDELLTPAEAKDEYVNLMRWQLEEDLGYATTHALELKNTRGGTLYHMVFATDSDAGEKIMSHLYKRAAAELPDMLREAREQRAGQGVLELGIVGATPDVTYEYVPPRRPPDPL